MVAAVIDFCIVALYGSLCEHRFLSVPVLGGSWVAVRGVISRITINLTKGSRHHRLMKCNSSASYGPVCEHRFLSVPVLGGSWVVARGATSLITMITNIRGPITQLISIHEPPSLLEPKP